MTHFRTECRHGTRVSTCRCMRAHKEVRIVDCPAHCPALREFAAADAPLGDPAVEAKTANPELWEQR